MQDSCIGEEAGQAMADNPMHSHRVIEESDGSVHYIVIVSGYVNHQAWPSMKWQSWWNLWCDDSQQIWRWWPINYVLQWSGHYCFSTTNGKQNFRKGGWVILFTSVTKNQPANTFHSLHCLTIFTASIYLCSMNVFFLWGIVHVYAYDVFLHQYWSMIYLLPGVGMSGWKHRPSKFLLIAHCS